MSSNNSENDLIKKLKNKLVVSCQALEGEPLHKDGFMACMALAAERGGAAGIRANGTRDIVQIKEAVSLPVIGLVKQRYDDSEVYITPTMDEIDELVEAGADIIALDATKRTRPGRTSLEGLFLQIKQKYPHQLLMADCATLQEGINACAMGFEIVSTTLCGYTLETRDALLPNFQLMELLAKYVDVPVFAEGGIWTLEELEKAFSCGVYTVVIGSVSISLN